MKTGNNIFDQIIFWLVMLLAVIPFGQIFYFRLPGIALDSFELIWLLMLVVLSSKLLACKRANEPFLILFFLYLAVTYIITSMVFYDVPIKAAVVHLRVFLPFLVALMLLAAGTTITVEAWIKGIVVAAGLSSFVALYIHHFAQNVLLSAFSGSEEMQSIVLNSGRLYWTNASLTFFVLLSSLCQEFRVKKVMLTIVMLMTFLAMFNTLNRTMLIGYGLFYVYAVLVLDNSRFFLKRISVLVAVAIGIFVVIIALYSFDERVASLIELRILGRGDLDAVYETALVTNRLGLYEQYLENLVQYFPFGQGLGRPFASILGSDIYTTDISVLSFVLPFGLVGLLIFVLFVRKCFLSIARGPMQISQQTKKMLRLFVIVFLLMSLNIDFFSRNNFVVFLTIVVISLRVVAEASLENSVHRATDITEGSAKKMKVDTAKNNA